MKYFMCSAEVIERANTVAEQIAKHEWKREQQKRKALSQRRIELYGVPRGGVPAAYAVLSALKDIGYSAACVVSEPAPHTYIIDDIIDSGATRERFAEFPFFALVDKKNDCPDCFVVFPWEQKENEDEGIKENIRRILQYTGEDVEREGLQETPDRVEKAWEHWTSGYGADISGILKTFQDGKQKAREPITVSNIPFYTHCEHHMAPFFGVVTISYVPGERGIVGLSKLNRLVDVFARRFQVQERLTGDIAGALEEHLGAVGIGVVIRARHLCMESRGVCQRGHSTITQDFRGLLNNQHYRSTLVSLTAAEGL